METTLLVICIQPFKNDLKSQANKTNKQTNKHRTFLVTVIVPVQVCCQESYLISKTSLCR